ncbi:MAG: basic amino acid ABC transporter substrate-binding protein [Christensenellaceae bacterium]
MKKVISIMICVILSVALLASCAPTVIGGADGPTDIVIDDDMMEDIDVPAAEPTGPVDEAMAVKPEGTVDTLSKIKKAGKLVMMTNASFAPYEYLGSDNKPAGVDIDMAQAIADAIGVKLEVIDMDFDALIPSLIAGKGDIVGAGLTITPERQESVDFSMPYADATQLIIVKADNTAIKSADDLSGKTIGVQLGTTGDIYVSDVEGATVKQYKTGLEAAMDLKNGKLDAVVLDQLPAQNIVTVNKDLMLINTPFTEEQYAMAVKKGDVAFLEVINGAIEKLAADGTVDKWTEEHATKAAA